MATTLNHKAGTELKNELPTSANVFSQQAVSLGNGRAVVFSFEEAQKQVTDTNLSAKAKSASNSVAGKMANKLTKQLKKGTLKLNNTQEKALKTFMKAKSSNAESAVTFLMVMKKSGMDPTPHMNKKERKILKNKLETPEPKSTKLKKQHGAKRTTGKYNKMKAHFIMGKSVERAADLDKPSPQAPIFGSRKYRQATLGL